MPYIKREDRGNLFAGCQVEEMTVGELNFNISSFIDAYLQGGIDYTAINTVIGVLECAKLELYRRVAAPYEDKKLAENGDVYESISSK